MCLRGHHSIARNPTFASIDLAYSEGSQYSQITLFLIVAGVIQLSTVQHLTTSAGGGGKGVASSPELIVSIMSGISIKIF